MADRESDFFEFLTQAKELRAKYLIRARTDRKLVPEDSEGCTRMLEALSEAPALGTMTVEIPGNGSRKARTASIQVRVAEVTIQAPPRRAAHAKASGSSEPVTVRLIGATEQSPPTGSESISWVLLTNLAVKDSIGFDGQSVSQPCGPYRDELRIIWPDKPNKWRVRTGPGGLGKMQGCGF